MHLQQWKSINGRFLAYSLRVFFLDFRPTFYKIYKRKSSEGYQSIPYSVALFSAMLYLYYAYLKKHVLLLITINSFGCVMELGFLTIFMVYATHESKVILILNFLKTFDLYFFSLSCNKFGVGRWIQLIHDTEIWCYIL